MTEILMSIHHKWAELIYSGEKTVELRKSAPKALDGDGLKVYLYETDLTGISWFGGQVNGTKSIQDGR